MKPEIIIVDDHLIFRQGLKAIINFENIGTVIGEATNGREFIELLSSLKPDLVLMDIDLPNMNGIEASERALSINPDMKIIILSMFNNEEYYYKLIDLGVKGYILKTSGIIELESAIRIVMLGGAYFSNELLMNIIKNNGKSNNIKLFPASRLTERENEILKLMCKGYNMDEIAEKLHISPMTIKTHKSNLLEKTATKNTPALILFALKNKIAEL